MILELLVVLAVIWLPLLINSIFARLDPGPRTLDGEWGLILGEWGSLLLLSYLVFRNGESIQILGLRPTRWIQELIWGIVIFVIAWVFDLMVGAVTDRLLGRGPELSVKNYDGLWLPVFLMSGCLFEEIFVRGYLFNRIEQLTRSRWLACLYSSLLFATYHPYGASELLMILTFGLVLSISYQVSRSVPRLVLAHFIFNVTVLWPLGS